MCDKECQLQLIELILSTCSRVEHQSDLDVQLQTQTNGTTHNDKKIDYNANGIDHDVIQNGVDHDAIQNDTEAEKPLIPKTLIKRYQKNINSHYYLYGFCYNLW